MTQTSAAILASLPSGPSLASVHCDAEPVLCNSLSLSPPAIYHILLSPSTEPVARWIPLNQTSVKPTDIVELHTKKTYLNTKPYTGPFQPWTGLLAQYGLQIPYGYAMWAIGLMPGWAPMIIVSFLSRSFM
jgi:hypothetical protein